ncbi:MAG: hypothetical protein ACRDQ1_00600, partial [Sciscionella sp.]
TGHGPAALAAALHHTRPLGRLLLDERLDHLPSDPALDQATRVLAAMPGTDWDDGIAHLAGRLGLDTHQVATRLAGAVDRWDADPRRAAQPGLAGISTVRERLTADPADASETAPAPTPPPPAPATATVPGGPAGGRRRREPHPTAPAAPGPRGPHR